MNDDKDDGEMIYERNKRKPNFLDKMINRSLNRTTQYEIN